MASVCTRRLGNHWDPRPASPPGSVDRPAIRPPLPAMGNAKGAAEPKASHSSSMSRGSRTAKISIASRRCGRRAMQQCVVPPRQPIEDIRRKAVAATAAGTPAARPLPARRLARKQSVDEGVGLEAILWRGRSETVGAERLANRCMTAARRSTAEPGAPTGTPPWQRHGDARPAPASRLGALGGGKAPATAPVPAAISTRLRLPCPTPPLIVTEAKHSQQKRRSVGSLASQQPGFRAVRRRPAGSCASSGLRAPADAHRDARARSSQEPCGGGSAAPA